MRQQEVVSTAESIYFRMQRPQCKLFNFIFDIFYYLLIFTGYFMKFLKQFFKVLILSRFTLIVKSYLEFFAFWIGKAFHLLWYSLIGWWLRNLSQFGCHSGGYCGWFPIHNLCGAALNIIQPDADLFSTCLEMERKHGKEGSTQKLNVEAFLLKFKELVNSLKLTLIMNFH